MIGPAPRPGLASVTYRQLTADGVVRLAVEAGLEAIEWAGDSHVPHGDLAQADRVADLCDHAGVLVCSYGSYYRAGHDDLETADDVVRTAVRLGAPNIRIWAGQVGSADSGDDVRRRVADDVGGFAELASEQGISVSLEFHADTLTDTLESTLRLLDDVATRAGVIRPYWQPAVGIGIGDARRQVDSLLPLLTTVHVYAWTGEGVRLPLRAAEPLWRDVLTRLADATSDDGSERFALLEFVRDDDPGELRTEAATLREWLDEAAG